MGFYGRKHTKETRQKMSESQFGHFVSEATRKRVSETRKARRIPSPMKGKTHSLATRRKISKALLGRLSPNKGKPLSDETKRKISEAKKGKPHFISKATKDKIRLGNTGKKLSVDTRTKMSITAKKQYDNGRDSPFLGKLHSKNTRTIISKKVQNLWKTKKWVRKQHDSRKLRPNKPEKELFAILNCLYPGEWKYTGDFSLVINGKCPDFINCNGQKKIIELFGDYWHRGDDPKDRTAVFEPFGYSTLVIWERELKNANKVIFRIHKFMRA